MKKKDRTPMYATAMIQIPLLVREDSGVKIRTPDDTLNVCKDMSHYAQEQIAALLLDAKNGLISRVMCTMGVLDASLVHPREVFRPAIERSAAAVVLVHNHPTGDTQPSVEDIRITKQLVSAGKIIDIRVLDHMIVGWDRDGAMPTYLSMREAGLAEFA